MINVAYSCSDSYCWLACTSIISLFENNKDSDFTLFLLSNEISDVNLENIRLICKKYNANLNVFDIKDIGKSLGKIKINKRWDLATFGRLFEANLFSDNIERVLHIDCDTIINGNITELYNSNIDDFAVAGVKDCLSKHYFSNIGISCDNYLFNAGILLFNLKYIRENYIVDRFIKKIEISERLFYLDQDILNCCLTKNEKKVLSLKYNFYSIASYCNYDELILIRKPFDYYKREDLIEAKSNPIIIHFTSCNLDIGRPWNKNNNHQYRNLFLKYLEMSPYKNKELIEIKKSWKALLMMKVPKRISYRFARLTNAITKPILLKNKERKINETKTN